MASKEDVDKAKVEKEELDKKIKDEENLSKQLECKISQHEKILTKLRVTLRNLEKEGIQKAKLKCWRKKYFFYFYQLF